MNRMVSRVRFLQMGALLLFAALILWFAGHTQSHKEGDVIKNMTPFTGGLFEASGAAEVRGAGGILFVDNGRPGQVFWMGLDQNGKQTGPIKPVNLGLTIEDSEGITTDGTYFYIVGSQSRPKSAAGAGLVRFKFDSSSQRVEAVESVSGLRAFLTERVPALGESGGKKSGLNIEGLAWDPRNNQLLLGLRSPLLDGQALLIPLKLRDPQGRFELANLEAGKPLQLALGGNGVRGIEYDAGGKAFKVISGATEAQSSVDFGLWEWSGDDKQPALRELNKFDKDLKAEGVARVSIGERSFVIVVFDAGGFTILN